MTISKISLVAVLSATVALSACTDPATLGAQTDPKQNTKQGAIFGGLLGAGVGALANSSNPALGAVVGGAVGAGAGALIGNNLDQQAAELRQQLANDGITVTNTGDRLIVSVPNDITFDTDSYTVRPALRSDLEKVAQNLLRYPESNVQIIGHTDSDGDAPYNQGLSERRAGAVADVIQAGGVTYNRISTLGQGENDPIASNLNEAGKAANRRVEIVVIPKST
ncbi:OmpA family protein [Phaeobacter sp. NW0010-22]|uniref:OmpA family protein n=1 Tax=Phaeobacter sp. NW0010-22 TaxID=3135907 RepID=UPI00310C4CE4